MVPGMSWVLVAVVVLLLAAEGSCFPGGAPAGACSTLAPSQVQHNAPPQTSPVPYELDNLEEAFDVNGTLGYIPGQTYQCKSLDVDNPQILSFEIWLS